MAKLETLTALDIGTSKVVCAIAECTRDGEIEIGAKGVAPCRGLSRGTFINSEETVEAIEAAITEAEKSGYAAGNVLVSLSSEFISSRPSRGMAAISGPDGEITDNDISRVIAVARQVGVPSDSEAVKVVQRSFSVDGQPGIVNPLGLTGSRLESEAYVCVASRAYLQNVRKVVGKSGLDIYDEGMIPAAMASALSVLTEEEKSLGAVLVDIGLGTVDLAIYTSGEVAYTAVLGQGGWILANDVAHTFNISLSEAERLILSEGLASPDFIDGLEQKDKELTAASASGEVEVVLQRARLAEVLEARLAEICDWIKERCEQAESKLGVSASGIVFTGGTSQLPGLAQLVNREIGKPVRVATPCYPARLPQTFVSPIYSCVVGLLLYGAVSLPKQEPKKVSTNFAASWWQKMMAWLNEVF